MSKDWVEANPDYMKDLYIVHSVERKNTQSDWRKANPNHHKNWRLDNPDYDKDWRRVNNVRVRQANKKYHKSDKGKISVRKSNAKRKRNFDWVELFDNPFSKDIPVVGHHISDGFVVYIPKSLHLNHLHGKYKQLHRDELKPYIEGIYDISYIVE